MTRLMIAIAALAAMNAAAHSQTTVDQWIALCAKGAPAACESYARGVADAVLAMQAVRPQLSMACIPAGATGKDAWLVFRARGDRGIFPILLKGDTVTPSTMPALLGGDFNAIKSALAGHGVPAAAFTSPVFVDFDGGGYRAPFAP